MTTELSSKKEIYMAAGFALALVVASVPLSMLGIKLLNFILGQIAF